MNNTLVRFTLGVLLALPLILHSADLLRIPALDRFENALYDMRLRYNAPSGIDPRVVIIDIDETSLDALGQWPWQRDVIARLVDTLFDQYQVGILGLDVVFAEPDIDPTRQALKRLSESGNALLPPAIRKLVAIPSRDELLEASLGRHPVVMGYTFRDSDQQGSIGRLPPPLFDADTEVAEASDAMVARRYTANVPILQGERPGGFFSLFNGFDQDGILRRVPLLTRYEDALYPLLAVSVTSSYLGLGVQPVLAGGPDDGMQLEALDFGLHQVELDPLARVFAPYRHAPGFRYISAVDVVQRSVTNPEDLAGAVALLGTSAAGLVDLRATPVSTVLPGVEVHANLVAAMMDGSLLRAPGWMLTVATLGLLLTAILLAALLPRLTASAMTFVAVLTLGLITSVNFLLWDQRMLVAPLAPFIVLTGVLFLLNVVYGYVVETRSRRELKRSFGLYVPPEIIDSMQNQSVDTLLRSEKKPMTVLFADVRGFTSISESMDPQALSDLMNAFLTPMTAIVHRHGGAIDKYMGDAIMAFWGAPLDEPAHSRKAVDAAVDMIRTLEHLNPSFADRGWPVLKIGVGINSGEMNVGNMGSEFRMAYTVLGDAVNLGARLEGLTKAYGVSILMSETTAADCAGYTLCELDMVRVKGKREPVRIFTPLGTTEEKTEKTEACCADFGRALLQYRAQNWQAARQQFTRLANLTENRTSFAQTAARFYLSRIEQLAARPPGDDWDGVYEFDTK